MTSDIPMLRKGSTGPYVRVVQEVLNLTFGKTRTPMVPDGVFGAKTDAAVRAFQERKKLVPDGIVGPLTHRALFPFAPYTLDVEMIEVDEGDDSELRGRPSLHFALPGNVLGQVAGNPPSAPASNVTSIQKIAFKPTLPGGAPIMTSPPGPGTPMPAPPASKKDEKKVTATVSVGGKVDMPKKTISATHPPKPNAPNPTKTAVTYSVQGVVNVVTTKDGKDKLDVSATAQAAAGTVKDSDGKSWNFSVTAKVTESHELVKLGHWGTLKIFGEAGVKGATNGATPSASASLAAGSGVSIKVTKDSRITFDIKDQTTLEGTLNKKGGDLHVNNSATGNLTVHF